MIALYSRQWSLLDPARLSKLVTTTSEVLVLGDRTRSSELALHVAGQARAPGPCEPWRGTVDASLLSIGEIDRHACERVAMVSATMMTAEAMVARTAHYTALLDTVDQQGPTKLLAGEREQLLGAADVLLFGEPDSERTVRSAEVLIEALEASERWSVESCDQLREHLYGCGAPSGAS